MKKTALWALPIAATLAVAGCAAESAPDAATQPSPSSTAADAPGSAAPLTGSGSTAPGSAATTAPATSPAPGVAPGKQLTANQLATVAQALAKQYGKDDAQVLKDAELRASMGTIEEVVAGMKVSPAECGAFAVAGISEALDRLTMAVLVLPAEANDLTTSISIASYDSAGTLERLQSQATENTGDCGKFSLTMQGLEATAEVRDVKASTTAQTTMATVTDVEVMGQAVTTLTVAGYDGRSNATVSISQPEDLETAVKKAEKYIDLALLHMGDK